VSKFCDCGPEYLWVLSLKLVFSSFQRQILGKHLCTPNVEYMELVQNNMYMVQQRGRSVVMRRAECQLYCVVMLGVFFFLEERASGLKAQATGFSETSAWCVTNQKTTVLTIPTL